MIASTLRRIRMALDLTQEEMAQKLGVSTVYIKKLETGERNISEKVCLKAMDLLTEGIRNNNDELFSLINDIIKNGEQEG